MIRLESRSQPHKLESQVQFLDPPLAPNAGGLYIIFANGGPGSTPGTYPKVGVV